MNLRLSRVPIIDRNDPALGLLLGLFKKLHPQGMKVDDIPIRDKIGILILCRALAHLSEDFKLRITMAIYTSEIGESTGLPMPKESSIELLYSTGN